LMLFLLARPRLIWIVMAVFSDKYGKTASVLVTTVSTHELHPSKTNTTLGIKTHELRPSKTKTTLGSDAVHVHECHDDPINVPEGYRPNREGFSFLKLVQLLSCYESVISLI